jgi:dienelactone hydrolase
LSAAAPVQTALEQVPSELSIDHLASMRLEGRDLTLEKVLIDNEAYVQHSITYYSNGLKISGILNIPKGIGPFPLIIFNHGHIPPEIYTVGRGLRREQDYIAKQGFAVLHTDYRGHGESDESPDTREIYDAGFEYAMDSMNAIAAVRAAKLPTVDATRVGMLGHSLGGGVTLNVLTSHPDLVTAAVLYAPVNSDAWENFVRWRRERPEGDRTIAALGTREENPAAWDALSSLSKLGDIATPILLFHGTADKDVPKAWSDALHGKLLEEEKFIDYVIYEGEGHEFAGKWIDFMRQSVAHFRSWLTPVTPEILDPARVTLKPFGIRIDPATSPVQPEKFSGYHTGADFELKEGEDPHAFRIPAICEGPVVSARTATGYGGVMVQRCTIDGQEVTVLYGHLDASSLPALNTVLRRTDPVGRLGKGFSSETDDERPHLHLSVHKGTAVELRGYVQKEADLSGWIDPLSVIR